jgi:hypothetical protein
MAEPLRWMLMVIVLLNLGFVQITSAVAQGWLVLLWSLAVAAPLLMRWHDTRAYTMAWNGLVIVVFSWLARDVTTSGMLHMLEDGLLLAALCQVHLLNNIGRRQRPDLLFFNSFLIAFVTSFFSSDLLWSLLFGLYAIVLVPALQLFVVLPRNAASPRGAALALIRDSLPRTLAIAGLTIAIFAVWPRDFERRGWIGETMQLAAQDLVAFAEEVRLDRTTTPQLTNTPVMRIRPAAGGAESVPLHWRGATFVGFRAGVWQPHRVRDFATRRATDTLWHGSSPLVWQRNAGVPDSELEVRLLHTTAGRLFLPLSATRVVIHEQDEAVVVDPKADAVLALDPFSRPLNGVEFLVGLTRRHDAPPRSLSARARQRLTQLPDPLPMHLRSLYQHLVDTLPVNASRTQTARHFESWLAQNRRYALPGTDGAVRNLGEFLLGTGGGHCEYFATALALLLRMHGVPCRLVGGYVAHEWDVETFSVIVRERDAHAWVEAILDTETWTTLDATPPANLERSDNGPSWWQQLWQRCEELWQNVTRFDDEGRSGLLWTLLALPGRAARLTREHPEASGMLLSALTLWLWWRRRSRRSPAELAGLRLRRTFRRVGVGWTAARTPREQLTAALDAGLPEPQARQLAAAVQRHEAARYAASGTAGTIGTATAGSSPTQA